MGIYLDMCNCEHMVFTRSMTPSNVYFETPISKAYLSSFVIPIYTIIIFSLPYLRPNFQTQTASLQRLAAM